MVIKNGMVFCEDKQFHKKDIYIEESEIVALVDANEQMTSDDENIVDATGCYVIPGLVDIHSHGAVGQDFSDGSVDGILKILAYEKVHGITSYCPTSMTLSREKLSDIFKSVSDACDRRGETHANLLGINMEGPFLDPKKKGAHVEENIMDPDVEFFRFCNEQSQNRIKLVTLAPNMPNAFEFIDALKDEVTISLGHTACDYETASKAFAMGANHVTHLYNAMQPFEHRKPGLIGAAFDCKDCMPELICDGIHINESVVRATFALFKDRVVLISDSMRATGLDDGVYDLGGQEVTVKGKLATLSDGTIAGSATNLFDCMRTAISFGIPATEAVAAATINPAESIGVSSFVGVIAEQRKADLLILDQDFQLVEVIA